MSSVIHEVHLWQQKVRREPMAVGHGSCNSIISSQRRRAVGISAKTISATGSMLKSRASGHTCRGSGPMLAESVTMKADIVATCSVVSLPVEAMYQQEGRRQPCTFISGRTVDEADAPLSADVCALLHHSPEGGQR